MPRPPLSRRRAIGGLALVTCLVTSACGGGGGPDAADSTTPVSQNTAALVTLNHQWPLTGLPVDGDLPGHGVFVVKIDNTDIRDLTLSGLRRNIGVVFQEVLLFDRSVAENLRVGKPDATEEEMTAACERAQVMDVIERNPEKFEMMAGERGRMFSGGERQRLSIARALLKDPPILILDEATSALDAVTEAKVQAALAEVMKGRTTFVIAHRLATIRNASRILVFESGRVTESGTFDELVRLGGTFADLAKTQFMAASVTQ